MNNSPQNITISEAESDRDFSLPEPTGDYAVGTTSYYFEDPEREETYTEDPNDNREITAKVWYPSDRVSSADTAPYIDEELSSAIASGLAIPPEEFGKRSKSKI